MSFFTTQTVLSLCFIASILALRELIEHADCVLPIENEALFEMSARMSTGNARNVEGQASASTNPFDSMNNIVGDLLCHLTASIRFEGTLNVDLNEISSTLVPFPSLHFLTASMCPLPQSDGSLAQVSPSRRGTKCLDQLFTQCFDRCGVAMLASLLR